MKFASRTRIVLLAFWAVTVLATPVLAANITIPDTMGTGTGWYSAAREDQEVEPNMETGQRWDLEGFLLNGTRLTMVGGFDFRNGASGYTSGDLFLDVDGTPLFGSAVPPHRPVSNGYATVSNLFGYDYALRMDIAAGTFDLYSLNAQTLLKTGYYSRNSGADPWKYLSGGSKVGTGALTYVTGLTNAQTGFLGGSHNAVTFDLSFLRPGTTFYSHFTMGCGNDDLMGKGTLRRVSEPASVSLLAVGMVGIAVWGRRRRRAF